MRVGEYQPYYPVCHARVVYAVCGVFSVLVVSGMRTGGDGGAGESISFDCSRNVKGWMVGFGGLARPRCMIQHAATLLYRAVIPCFIPRCTSGHSIPQCFIKQHHNTTA